MGGWTNTIERAALDIPPVPVRTGETKSTIVDGPRIQNLTKAEQILELMLSGVTAKEAAKQVGVSERTAFSWFKADWFKNRLAEAKSQLMQATANRLQSAAIKAVNVLLKIAQDENASDTARVTASVKIIELAAKTVLTETLQKDVDELKERLNTYNGHLGSVTGTSEDAEENDGVTIEADSD
jgi:hypothetical protein